MGTASTLSSRIVHHIEPDCKGWHANLADQHQENKQQNIPNPTGMSNPIAIT